MKNKSYLIILVVSLILTFAIAPLRMFQLFENPPLCIGTLIRGIIFWVVTVHFLNRYSSKVKPYKIVLMVLLADLTPDIIVRVFMGEFIATLPSLPDVVLQIIAVLLGWWYTTFNKKGKVILALANLLICIGVSSYSFVVWNELDFIKNSQLKKMDIVDILNRGDSVLLQDSIISKLHDKNLIVYVGGEDYEKNEIGLSFLQKVKEEFKGNNNIVVLSLICLDNPKTKQLSVNTKYPIVCMNMDKSGLKESALYYWYVVDKNKKIRYRNKITLYSKSDMQNELQFLKEYVVWQNDNAK